MKPSRIAAVLLAIVLSTIATGCVSSGENRQDPEQSISQAPRASKNPADEKEVVARPYLASPSGQLPQNLVTSQKAVLQPPANYWASDWCHYFVGSDGITYGDTCLRAKSNGSGGSVPNQFLLYRYDPTAAGLLGPATMEFYTGYAGYTTYRDLTNPDFNTVAWMTFPTGQPLSVDTILVGVFNANNQLIWYRFADLLASASNGTGTAPNSPLRVPSSDPAVTVFSYGLLPYVFNIPTGMY